MREDILTYTTKQLVALALAVLLALGLWLATERPLGAAPGDHVGVPPIEGAARVIDGDTIMIGEERIRLEGIDAPETGQRCADRTFSTWDCGAAATRELERMTRARSVACERRGVDKYGRTLATCFADGRDVGAELVRRGLAWAFVRYSTAYVGEEKRAREEKLGVWQAETQTAWDYRANRWAAAETGAPAGCAIKGNVSRQGRIYHMPWSPWYHKVRMDGAEGKRWFCTEAEAVAAGWRPAYAY